MSLTKKHIIQILCNADLKLQTAILLVFSGGLKINELAQLRFNDIDFTSKPTKILIRATSKNRIPHQIFITEEATIQLQKYLKKYFGWHKNSLNLDLNGIYIFDRMPLRKSDRSQRFNLISVKQSLWISLRNHIKNVSKLLIKNENGLRTIHFQAFRKYFKTTVENVCGKDYVEALMGHRFYMDTYYQLSDEEKHQKYLSVEPYLTIFNFEKVEQQYAYLSKKYEEMEKSMSELNQILISNNILIPESLK